MSGLPDRHKRKPISFRPPERNHDRLLSYAERTGTPVRAILAEALDEFLAAHDDETQGRPLIDVLADWETPQARAEAVRRTLLAPDSTWDG